MRAESRLVFRLFVSRPRIDKRRIRARRACPFLAFKSLLEQPSPREVRTHHAQVQKARHGTAERAKDCSRQGLRHRAD